MNPISKLILAVVAIAIFATGAHAQPAAPASMPAIPQSTCVKPEFPNLLADQRRFATFDREYKAYSECVKKYIEETRAQANAAVAAGQKVIDEYNAFNEELKARQAAK